MLRIAVCDDDINFLNSFGRMVSKSFADIGQAVTVFTFSDGKSLIEKTEKEKQVYDIIFLDVEMPSVNGFKVAQRLRELDAVFLLIFTTFIEHKSREGYLYGAFRYIFKNNLEAELNEAVAGIVKKLDLNNSEKEEITFKRRNSGVLENLTIKKVDIIFLKAEKTRRVTLATPYSEYDLLVKPLSEYAKILEPLVFATIMRGFILNFNHVTGIEGDFFMLTGGYKIPLGIKRDARKTSMEKYLRYLRERL